MQGFKVAAILLVVKVAPVEDYPEWPEAQVIAELLLPPSRLFSTIISADIDAAHLDLIP
jgi:hypothetical protein